MGSAIHIRGVSKRFVEDKSQPELNVLEDVTLDVAPGQFLAVVGPSGCGKSTLLSMVAGLQAPSEGSVAIDDKEIREPNPDVGVVFQDYALFPWMTVRDNVGFGPRCRGVAATDLQRLVRDLLDLVSLSGSEDKYPHQLSGGMRQRCALARMLANDPDVLLMDEPLAALDAQTRTILQGELLRIWGEHLPGKERRTVFFVTHAIDEAVYLADRIVVLSRRPGKIKSELDNPLPRPREDVRRNPEFLEVSDHIWQLIEQDARAAAAESTG